MTNLMQDGAEWLTGELLDSASVPVTYRQDRIDVPLDAVRRTHHYKTVDAHGIGIVVRSSDWLIPREQLMINGKIVEPRPGALVFYGTERYEVMRIEQAPCFEPHDVYGNMLVVHSNCVRLG